VAINLREPSADFFDREAEDFAKSLTSRDQRGNLPNTDKPSQLRRFYDHLVQLDDRIKQVPTDFDVLLPDIRMLNAHIAYAHGRKLVSDTFREKCRKLFEASRDRLRHYIMLGFFLKRPWGFCAQSEMTKYSAQ